MRETDINYSGELLEKFNIKLFDYLFLVSVYRETAA